MYKKYFYISLLILSCMPFGMFSSTNSIASNNGTLAPTTSTKVVGQIPSGTIYILNDTAFSSNYNLPGSGTKDDPYRIENYNITPDQFYGIGISDVTKYVVIKNCTIDASNGISIDWVAPGRVQIISNYITHAHNGINIYLSDGVLIANNTLVDTYDYSFSVDSSNGVNIIGNSFINSNGSRAITKSRDIIFSNNTIKNTLQPGLSLQNSDNVSVLNSQISSNNMGIELVNSSNNNFIGNNVSFNTNYGLSLDANSHNNIIYYNQFQTNNKNYNTKSQGLDDGNGNYWYSKDYKIGNYWSDWNTGDYLLDGLAQNKDIYPLTMPQYTSIDLQTFTIASSLTTSLVTTTPTSSLDMSFIGMILGSLVLVSVTLVRRKR